MKKGFTLIELLIVIGILAILASAVVLVLNPAELLRQARDSTRVSDMATLRSAISLYLASQTANIPSTGGLICGIVHGTCTADADRTVDGNGWVRVNFVAIPGGSPLSVLPIDPVNTVSSTYGYMSTSTVGGNTFELNAAMESARYVENGPDDLEGPDGGNETDCYEVGSELTLTNAGCE